MHNLSLKTTIAVDTGNYTAWTVLTSRIMANGSLLIAGGLLLMAKLTLEQSHNALILKDDLKYWSCSVSLFVSFPQMIK